MVAVVALVALATLSTSVEKREISLPILEEEAPDVFLAKATLQQYLSRIVRQDWDGVKRLTHPKALSAIEQAKRRSGSANHDLAPWTDPDVQLKTFRFVASRQVAPGVVLVQVGEDSYRTAQQGMSVDDPAVYFMFKSHGGFLVGDKKAGLEMSEVPAEPLRAYRGYVDTQVQVQAQARREPTSRGGRHR